MKIRVSLLLVTLLTGGALTLGSLPGSVHEATAGPPVLPDGPGIPVTADVVIRNCSACHAVDDDGRMSRVSYMRKTPEGWQASIQRMMALQGVQLDPATAREIVRYLSDHHGLAPEELEPARFEVERRSVDFRYPDEDVRETCAACHSMGMAMTQRRTEEEWRLLEETHRGYYPRIDGQRFRRGAPPGDAPVDRARRHLAERYPFETVEWAEWSANLRSPRLEGRWVLRGSDPARGPFFGTVEISSSGSDDFATETTYEYPAEGLSVARAGQSVVYTGYQWRGRSSPQGTSAGGSSDGAPSVLEGELREVMVVQRDWDRIDGRWFTGDHHEFGVDVELIRVGVQPVVAGIHPASLRIGTGGGEVTVYGGSLPSEVSASDVDLGPGIQVEQILEAREDRIRLRVEVDPDAPAGRRDLRLGSASFPRMLTLFHQVDYLEVEPRAGMARVGGIASPKQYQQFQAIGYQMGPDGEPGSGDDLRVGPVPVEWEILEYPVGFEDDDAEFVGEIDHRGLFTPGLDGLNPERAGDRNNMGDVWVRARYTPSAGDGPVLEARSYLLVSAPVYMRWDPWTLGEDLRP